VPRRALPLPAPQTHLFDFLPEHVRSILYIDADVVVARPLAYFMEDLRALRATWGHVDFAMFLDAAGHMLRVCSGCDRWHTGVIYLERSGGGLAKRCMDYWRRLLEEGGFETDQAAVDHAEEKRMCTKGRKLPSKHLLFAKDYVAMLLTPTRTFIHLTAAGRLDTQSRMYSEWLVPRIMHSLGLHASRLGHEKHCPGPVALP